MGHSTRPWHAKGAPAAEHPCFSPGGTHCRPSAARAAGGIVWTEDRDGGRRPRPRGESDDATCLSSPWLPRGRCCSGLRAGGAQPEGPGMYRMARSSEGGSPGVRSVTPYGSGHVSRSWRREGRAPPVHGGRGRGLSCHAVRLTGSRKPAFTSAATGRRPVWETRPRVTWAGEGPRPPQIRCRKVFLLKPRFNYKNKLLSLTVCVCPQSWSVCCPLPRSAGRGGAGPGPGRAQAPPRGSPRCRARRAGPAGSAP